MEIKYAIRQIDVIGHAPAYLQESEYGLGFTFRASDPSKIHYFETNELAKAYIAEHLHFEYVEIVEVYVRNK